MALNNLGLGFIFTAKDLASGTVRRLGRNFNKMSATSEAAARRMKRAMITASAGVGLLVAGVGALGSALALANQAGKFEFGLARVSAISRASAADLARLSAAARQAGIDTQFSPTEATEGLANLAAQGFNATESIRLLGPALDLAAGGQIDIGAASAVAASAIKVFGLNVDEGALAVDKLLRISNKTALQVGDLQLALGTVARGAIAAGQSLDEMLPAMGLVKNAGVDASVAASSVSSALQFMAKNAKAFKKVGVEVTDANGRFKPFLDVVLETEKALGDRFPNDATRAAKAIKLFGRFGVSAFTNIAKQLKTGITGEDGQKLFGIDAVNDLRKSMRNAEGAAEEFRTKLLNTFQGQKILLKGSMQTLGIELGSTFATAFKPVVSGIITVVNTMIKVIAGIPKPVKDAIGKMILLFGGLATAGGIVAILSAAMFFLKGAFVAVGAAMVAVAAVLAPIIALVGIVALAFKGYATTMEIASSKTDFFTRTWAKLSLAYTAVVALITGNPVSKVVIDDLNKAENKGIKQFVTAVGQMLNIAESFFEGMVTGFSHVFLFAEPVFDAFGKALGKLGEAFGFVGDTVDGVAGTKLTKFVTMGRMVGRFVGGAILLIIKVMTVMISTVAAVISGWEDFVITVKLVALVITSTAAAIVGAMLIAKGAVIALTAAKTAWLFVTNAQKMAVLSINIQLLVLRARVALVTVTVKAIIAAKAIWGAIMSGNLIKLALTNARLGVMAVRSAAAAVAQKGLAGSMRGMRGSLLGKLGILGAIGATTFAMGTWLDQTFKLSDGLQSLIGDITGLNAKMDELDKKNGGIIRERKSAGFLPGPDGKFADNGPVVVPTNAVGASSSAAASVAAQAVDTKEASAAVATELKVAVSASAKSTGKAVKEAITGMAVIMESEVVGRIISNSMRTSNARGFGQVDPETEN